MANPTVGVKNSGQGVTADEFNNLVDAIKTKQDEAKKAFAVTAITTGYDITHNFGTALGLTVSQFALEIRSYDANGELVGGITVSKTSLNIATLVIATEVSPFTGTVILDATPF